MSIIKVINGKKEVIADKSTLVSHEQLQGREAYGAHPISAIRKLPEKLYALKQADEALKAKTDELESIITSDITNNIAAVNAKIDAEVAERLAEVERVESTTKQITIVEDEENKGKLLFTNYEGETTAIQGGFLPDEDTITLVDNEMTLKQVHTDETISGKGTEAEPLSAVAISDGTTKYTPSDIKTTVDNINTKLNEIDNQNENQDNRIYTLETITTGIGGYLNSYDFGANPTQEALTAYALQDIDETDATNIFNGTKVINLYNNHIWVLTNTPNSEPAVFNWEDLGEIPAASVATDKHYGLVKSSYEDLQGSIDTNGNITINNLDLKLEEINTDITEIKTNKKYLHSISGRISLGPCYGSISFQFINNNSNKMGSEADLAAALTALGFTGTTYSNANALSASGYYKDQHNNDSQGIIYGIYANGSSVYCIYAKRKQTTTTLIIDNVETTVVTDYGYEREIMSTYNLVLGMNSYIKEVVTEI